MERGMKPRKKRVMEPSTEPVMEREMWELKACIHDQMQEMKREQKAYIHDQNQEMKRELKAYIHDQNQKMKREVKAYIHDQIQGAPADWNLYPRPSHDHRMKSEGRVLQLRFANKLADKIYTGDQISDVSDRPVQINLIDTISGKIEEVGPLSSVEIEFVVLDDAEDQEFNAIIVDQRPDKRPLLKGKVIITLTAGVGSLKDLSFVDNSSWRPTKKFKLGARVKQSSSMGQVRIKEAVSEAFAVRDHRGKRAKKHDLPSLNDEVWHLKKVKRGGKFHTRLIDNDIQTVKDFLDMYKTEPEKLRKILKDCTDKDWKAIEQDVSCVVLDDVSTVLHQGMQNGLSKAICPDFPLSTNAQGEQGDFCFQKLSNSDSGPDSSQILSEVDFINKINTHPMTESFQNNNGLHSHISTVQPVSSALDDGKFNADSNLLITQKPHNSPTTGTLPHESPGLHQGFVGMYNNYDNASLSHTDSGFLRETGQNLVAMPTHSTNFNAQLPCNVIFQHQNNGYGDPGRTPPQFNRSDSNFIQSSQISSGLNPTTGQLPHEFPCLHQGFTGKYNNYNNASLPHTDSGFLRETGQNLAAMPTYSPNFNAQLPCNVIFQHQNNGDGDPGRTPPQFNGSDSNFIQSSQISNGLNPTTGQLPHESPSLHQGMYNNYSNASLSHTDSGFLRETDQNLAAMPTHSPNFNAQLPCNVIFQHQNNGYGDLGRTPPQFNGSNSNFIQSSQIRNGLHGQSFAAEQYPQNTVIPPSDSSNELAAMVGNHTPSSMQNR